MEIDDKEIDELLVEFQSKGIVVPMDELDIKLQAKLKELKPRKTHKIFKGVVASFLIIVLTYISVPNFRAFANEVISNVLRDKGVQNAIDNGYPKIPDIVTKIENYTVNIYDIYIDEQRLTFEAKVSGFNTVSNEESYIIEVKNDINDVTIESYGFSSIDPNTKVQIQGGGVTALLHNKTKKIPLTLIFKKDSNTQDGARSHVIGESTVVLKIPEALFGEAKIFSINKNIVLKRGCITLNEIKVSPTMMTLIAVTELKGVKSIKGFTKLSLTGDSGKIYNGEMSSAFDYKGNVEQHIVPSMYFDKNKKITLRAEGYSYEPESKLVLDLSINEKYPKVFQYDKVQIMIKSLTYKEGGIEMIIDRNENIDFLQPKNINGKEVREFGYSPTDATGNPERYWIPTEKKGRYDISIEGTLKQKEPIKIEFNTN